MVKSLNKKALKINVSKTNAFHTEPRTISISTTVP